MANQESKYTSPWASLAARPGGNKSEPPREFNIMRFVFVGLALLFIAGVVIVMVRRPQGPNVGIQIFTKPEQVPFLGNQFTLYVSFSNYSDLILKNAKVSLMLPDGVSFVGQSSGQRVIEQAVGDLGPGSINQQPFKLIATFDANSLKHIEAKLSYGTSQNSGAFESKGEADILVGQPAINLSLSAPQNVLNGQDFEVKIDYANNTGDEFKDARLKMDYPPVFRFKRASVATETSANNSWNLGTITGGSHATITITGSVIGQENSSFSFNSFIAATFQGETYNINTQTANISIATAPLSVSVSLNNATDYVAHIGDTLNYSINYVNNSDIIMQNISVSAKLTGAMFDFQSLQSNIPFSSLTNTITWFAGNTPQLLNLAPKQSGSIEFSIRAKDQFPIRLLSDKNFTLKLDAEIESPTIPPNTSADKTISIASIENKVAGKADLTAVAYWRDAASGILNSGPYPPRVNQPTRYTIHWKIVNYSTDLTDITVSAFLQAGVRFTNVVKSNVDTSPVYVPSSGLVSWSIPALAATKGVVGTAPEAIFQVEATPAVNQVNGNMPLISETKFEATDSFVAAPFSATAQPLDTSLPADTAAGVYERAVKP